MNNKEIALLEQVVEAIDKAPDIMNIKGKTLADAQKEQTAWPIYYEGLRSKLARLIKLKKIQLDRVKSEVYVTFNEKYTRELSHTQINTYIDGDATVVELRTSIVELETVLEDVNAILEAFKMRGYALKDLTSAMINELHNNLI